ncbi:hypothetical protein CDEF62S_00033 [Castellaniella defragrans]
MRLAPTMMLAALVALGTATTHAKPTEPSEQIHNIRGFFPDLSFKLQAAGGRTMTQKALRGKVVLMYFGYSNCPDVCPTTMIELAQVIKLLGPERADARIVFVSVDPGRDTPAKLQTYVRAFSKDAIGLTGSSSVITDIARRYRVAYEIKPPTTADKNDYVVTHSRGIYIFDQRGHARLLASGAAQVKALASDVRQIIEHPDNK